MSDVTIGVPPASPDGSLNIWNAFFAGGFSTIRAAGTTGTVASGTFGGYTIVLQGFAFTNTNGVAVTSGTITGISLTALNGPTIVSISGVSLDAAAFISSLYTLPDATAFHALWDTNVFTVNGSGGFDYEFGGNNADHFAASLGNDIIDGGGGNDTVSYAPLQKAIYAELNANGGTVVKDGNPNFAYDVLTSIETVVGTYLNDTFVLGSGSYTIDGGTGVDSMSYVALANDTVTYTITGHDATAVKGSGTDTLTAFSLFQGSKQSDTFNIANSTSNVGGDQGNDTFNATNHGYFAIDGGVGLDIVNYNVSSSLGTLVHNPDGSWNVSGVGFNHYLVNVEWLHTTDIDVALGSAAGCDIGGDGKSDLMLFNSAGQVANWQMNGGSVGGSAYLGQAFGWAPVTTGDFDGNGSADFISANSGYLLDYRLNSAGQPSTISYLAYLPGWSVMGAGDFNADGRSDLVLQSGGTIINWIMGPSGTPISSNFLGSAPGWRVAAVGDFNGDTHADVLLKDASGSLVEWMSNRSGGFASAKFLGVISDADIIRTGDLNGDGRSDLVIQHLSDAVTTWISGPDGSLSSPNYLGLPAGWDLTTVGDYNGDGNADLMLQKGGTLVEWQLQNGLLSSASLITANGLSGWLTLG